MAKESLFKIINDRQSLTNSLKFNIHPNHGAPFLFQINEVVPIIDALSVAEDLQRAVAELLSRVANEQHELSAQVALLVLFAAETSRVLRHAAGAVA